MRAQIVKNHHVTKGSYTSAGFFDGSLEEKAKKEGDDSVRRLINAGLDSCTVLCVLIGHETYMRRWVQYEIFKSIALGMGVVGIQIHEIADPKTGRDQAGISPFACLGFGRKQDKLCPMIHYATGWKDAPYQSLITESAAPYLVGKDRPMLSSLFVEYNWMAEDGYSNFAKWIESAARAAGR
ncbi:MAG: hypothetical protein V7609_1830 [Verrucomicrobiota bacterium]